VIFPGYNVPRI